MLKEVPLLCQTRRDHDHRPQQTTTSGHDPARPIWIDDSDDEGGDRRTPYELPQRFDSQASKRTLSIHGDRTSAGMLRRRQIRRLTSYKAAPNDTLGLVYPDLSVGLLRAGERAISTSQDLGPVRFLDSSDASNLLEHLSSQRAQPMHRNQRTLAKSDRRAERGSIRNLSSSQGTRDEPIDLESCFLGSVQRECTADLNHQRGHGSYKGARSRECLVCGDAFPATKFPFLSACKHLPQTCPNCYAEWISVQLKESGWREVKCPENNCDVKLTYTDILHTTTPKTFEQYDTFLTRTALNEDRKPQPPYRPLSSY